MLVKKITSGSVIQTFDSEKKSWVSQKFVAGDQCDYEDETGTPVEHTEVMPSPEPYLPFDMVQPKEE
jgi:hypothetical protein